MSAIDASKIDWIGVDWGTSHVRAWAISEKGDVLARTSSKDGMGRLSPDEFEPALVALIGAWLSPECAKSVIACGIVGARQGWVEAPYNCVPCVPLPVQNLMGIDSENPGLDVYIVPGLKQVELADVMRVEETQIGGVLSQMTLSDGVICLPGTHSKWAKLSGCLLVWNWLGRKIIGRTKKLSLLRSLNWLNITGRLWICWISAGALGKARL